MHRDSVIKANTQEMIGRTIIAGAASLRRLPTATPTPRVRATATSAGALRALASAQGKHRRVVRLKNDEKKTDRG